MKNIIKNFLTGLPIVIFIILAFGVILFVSKFEITKWITLFLAFVFVSYGIGYLNNLSK